MQTLIKKKKVKRGMESSNEITQQGFSTDILEGRVKALFLLGGKAWHNAQSSTNAPSFN